MSISAVRKASPAHPFPPSLATHLVQGIGQGVNGCTDRLALGVELCGAACCGNGVLKAGQRLQHLAQQAGVAEGNCHATASEGVAHVEGVTQQQSTWSVCVCVEEGVCACM